MMPPSRRNLLLRWSSGKPSTGRPTGHGSPVCSDPKFMPIKKTQKTLGHRNNRLKEQVQLQQLPQLCAKISAGASCLPPSFRSSYSYREETH